MVEYKILNPATAGAEWQCGKKELSCWWNICISRI